MEETRTELLEEEIEREIRKISELDAGSEQKAKEIENLTKLHKLAMDEKKLELEVDGKEKDAVDRKKEQKKERRSRIAIALLQVIVPAAVYFTAFSWGLKYEYDGNIFTSKMAGKLLPNFKPKN